MIAKLAPRAALARNLRAGAALALVLGLVTNQPVMAADANSVVATVNGTAITLGHMAALRASLPPEYLQLPDQILFDGILDQLVQQAALAAVGETEVTRKDELTLENTRRGYLAGVVLDKVAMGAASDSALQALYDERYAQASPATEYNAAHILVPTEDEAKAIKARIDGGEDFAKVAQEVSTGPSGQNGGDLGWFGLGMMVEPFETAVVAMKPGEVSAPVQTQFGWHVIRLNEIRDAEAPKLDDVRDQLAAELQEKAVTEKIAEITGAAAITKTTEGIDPTVLKDEALLAE